MLIPFCLLGTLDTIKSCSPDVELHWYRLHLMVEGEVCCKTVELQCHQVVTAAPPPPFGCNERLLHPLTEKLIPIWILIGIWCTFSARYCTVCVFLQPYTSLLVSVYSVPSRRLYLQLLSNSKQILPAPLRTVSFSPIGGAGQTAAGAARSSVRYRQQSQVCGGKSSVRMTGNAGSR